MPEGPPDWLPGGGPAVPDPGDLVPDLGGLVPDVGLPPDLPVPPDLGLPEWVPVLVADAGVVAVTHTTALALGAGVVVLVALSKLGVSAASAPTPDAEAVHRATVDALRHVETLGKLAVLLGVAVAAAGTLAGLLGIQGRLLSAEALLYYTGGRLVGPAVLVTLASLAVRRAIEPWAAVAATARRWWNRLRPGEVADAR